MPVNRVKRNGSYAPLSAHYYKDDAIDEAGEAAELLYVRGLAFCADVLSDGFISDRQLVRFVGVGMFDAQDRADRLVDVGLWDRTSGGYQVRSWLDWNRSREEITDFQKKDAERKRPKDSAPPETPPPKGPPKDSGRNPDGIPTESSGAGDGSPDDVHTDSGSLSSAGARARSTNLHDSPRQDSLLGDEPAAKPKRRRTQLPAAWRPNAKHQQTATESGLDVDHEAEQFRNHAAANGRLQIDWDAAFRQWLGNAKAWRGDSGRHLKAVAGGYQPYRNPTDESVWDQPLLPPNPSEER